MVIRRWSLDERGKRLPTPAKQPGERRPRIAEEIEQLPFSDPPSIDDISPPKMIALDGLWEVLAIDNYVKNHKCLINSYVCENCHFAITTVDRHVGDTPSKMMCLDPSPCKGEMVTRAYQGNHHVDNWAPDKLSHEWFRPLSEGECATVRTQLHQQVERDLQDQTFTSAAERDRVRQELASEYARWFTQGGLAIRRYQPPQADPPGE